MLLTYEQFKACTRSHEAFASRYRPFILDMLATYGIDKNKNRLAGFLATIGTESLNLEKTEESLYYKDPLRLAKIFLRAFDTNHDKAISPAEVAAAAPFCRNPGALAKKLYDGYQGRGLIQLTWKKNYQAYMDATGVDVVSHPELLEEPEDAFRSAAWFWHTNGCNVAADSGSMRAITLKVNGPALMALAERTERFNENLAILK